VVRFIWLLPPTPCRLEWPFLFSNARDLSAANEAGEFAP